MALTRSNIYRRKECGQCGAADIGAYGLGCHHDPNGADMRTYVAIDALLTDETVLAAAHELATRLVNPEFGPTHYELKMREQDRARTAIRAAVDAVTGKDSR
jgi:hypothetical protein